ncbi:MAG: hypothetical protein H7X88_12260 [Gloeobacteraceae cyanobacterium ES-bin-316]|nr:hypothetical protein [Ferruginibacter sp.]
MTNNPETEHLKTEQQNSAAYQNIEEVTPVPENPLVAIEKDEDELVHQQAEGQITIAIEEEKDLDEVVHQQTTPLPLEEGEKDIDDLMHR